MTQPIRLEFSARALRDIRNILQYTEDAWGSEQEEIYRNILRAAFQRIQSFPDIGHVVEGKPSSLREHVLRHHVIQYRREPESVTILRVLNPRRRR